MAVGSSGRRRSRGALSAAKARRSVSASAVGARSRMASAPTVIRSVASWPTRHMIASIGLNRSVMATVSHAGSLDAAGDARDPVIPM